MKIFPLFIPLLFISVFSYAAIKKVNVYDSFTEGIKKAVPLILSIFPYVAATLIMTELAEKSGLADLLIKFLKPIFSAAGIPSEIAKLALIKPFSGSGAIAALSEIIKSYGADSYIARCACAAYGSSETTFYIGALYFSSAKKKSLLLPLLIALFSSAVATISACFFCRIL